MNGIFHKFLFQALLYLDTKKVIIKKINGVDILLISQRLGHSNIAMTLNVYSHLYPSKENEAIELINKLKGLLQN